MEPLVEYMAVCQKAVRAGASAIHEWAGNFSVSKKGPKDLVTQADLASQQAIRETIWAAFPDHAIIGEEDARMPSEPNAAARQSGYRWIVDPLDGTTNFVHGVPHYAVSLALERDGELLVGAVLDPLKSEFFTAAAGQGARLNDQPIHTSNVALLSEALGVVGFPSGVKPDSLDLRVFSRVIFECQSVHRSGSTALNLAYLAAGRYDVFWSFSSKIWDIAAGILLLREAGGAICNPDGVGFRLGDPAFLAAANPGLLAELRRVCAESLR
jgi:myo-inositol-1(or 4)-monophosphatase